MTTYLEAGDATPADPTNTNVQGTPSVAVLANGNYVVVWEQNSLGYMEVYAADGTMVQATTQVGQREPDVAALAGGGFVIVSRGTGAGDDEPFGPTLHAQTFNADGTPSSADFRPVEDAGGNSGGAAKPHVAAAPGGGFIAEWQVGSTVYGQAVDASNHAVGSKTTVGSADTANHAVSVAALADGSFVYAMSVKDAPGAPAGSGYNIYLVHQAADGTLSGLIAPEVTFTGDQRAPDVVDLTSGGYAVTWYDSQHVYTSVFNKHDQPVQLEGVVNIPTPGVQQYPQYPKLAATADGGFVVTWYDNNEILSRTYNGHGYASGNPALVTDPLDSAIVFNPAVAVNTDGEMVFAWNSEPHGLGAAEQNIYTRAYHPIDNSDGVQELFGTSGADVLNGGDGDDKIEGGNGDDTLDGGAGNDTVLYYFARSGVTVSLAMDGVPQNNGNEGTDTLYNFENVIGSRLNDTLYGNSGANVIDGGNGDDTLYGGAGNDTYYVDSSRDKAIEDSVPGVDDGGIDTVVATGTFALGSYLENLVLAGTGSYAGYGNFLNNIIIGNSGDNSLHGSNGDDVLDGGAGRDQLDGGPGNDTYYVDNTGDNVIESTFAGEGSSYHEVDPGGIDQVFSSVTYHLTKRVENLTLVGGSAIDGFGNELNNILIGNAGNNRLDGGAGADTLSGGAGNDTYIVDSLLDVVSEEVSPGVDATGIDTVQSSVNFELGALLENLTLTGTGNISGHGNDIDNVITGNSGANDLRGNGGNDWIDGGAGADTMHGDAGNDTYVVDNAGDKIFENNGTGVDEGGTDTVRSSINFSLASFLENLTLTGTNNRTGTGNDLDNHLTGNTGHNTLNGLGGNDVLDGGASSDVLYGGAGDDTYYVDVATDKVHEDTVSGVDDGGTDAVFSLVSFTLGAFIENLTLTGSAKNGIGNASNNIVTGNDAANTLKGQDGNDTLIGGGGNDSLYGGAGADSFVFDHFGTPNGRDHVRDFETGIDHLVFTAADFGFTAGHILMASEFTIGARAAGNQAQFWYNPANHDLYWDANGSTSGGATVIATFDNAVAPAAGDFVFV